MAARTASPRGSTGGDTVPYVIVGVAALVAAVDAALVVGVRLASVLTGHGWAGPSWSFTLLLTVGQDGVASVTPAPAALVWTMTGLVLVALLVPLVALGMLVSRMRRGSRALSGARDVAPLTPAGSAAEAIRLRPSLAGMKPLQVPEADRGLVLGTLQPRGPVLRASWESVMLAVMAPRAGKTTALAVPHVLDAPGWAVATSNKADLWLATAQARTERGRVWLFDPQSITHSEQGFWWNPLVAAKTVSGAQRLAGHFIQEVRGDKGDRDFWTSAAQDLLTALILAAAVSGRTLTHVYGWLNDSANPEPARLLDTAGERDIAASLRGRQQGAPDTREGIFETARTAAQCLRDKSITAWVTPRPQLPELAQAAFVTSTDTLYLLSKDGAGAAAPLVAALVDAVMRAGVVEAEQQGGRLDPPGVVVIDEAANVCRIADLPDLYSHLGSRGILPLTILQSYRQGQRVWGEIGMDTLWGAATVKIIGAGLDDAKVAEDISRLIGEEDVDVRSYSTSQGKKTSSVSVRQQRVLSAADVRALPKGQAILLVTGVKAAIIKLLPWYAGPRAEAIAAATKQAERQLTDRARAGRATTTTDAGEDVHA